jgi:hypothetical protein
MVAAVSTFACCVPLGFLGALGLAGLSVWAQSFRPWLIGASIVFLLAGFVQLYFRKSVCVRRGTASVVLFWTAVVVVLVALLFPQVIASLLAG